MKMGRFLAYKSSRMRRRSLSAHHSQQNTSSSRKYNLQWPSSPSSLSQLSLWLLPLLLRSRRGLLAAMDVLQVTQWYGYFCGLSSYPHLSSNTVLPVV